MKNLLQRSLAAMLALVMGVSAPATGLIAYAAPTVSENMVEEVTTEEESSSEEASAEESTEETPSVSANEILSTDEASVDLSLLSKITFNCDGGDIFMAEVTASDPEATLVHHTPENEETNETVFYNNHILYSDSDITVSITPYDKYWAYTDTLEVAATDLTTMKTTTELITYTEKIDGTYSFLLPVDLTKHYSVRCTPATLQCQQVTTTSRRACSTSI